MKDPFRLRHIGFESGLEEKVAHYFMASWRTADLREQQLGRYRTSTGLGSHWFDFVRTLIDGRRIAYAVKYADDVDDELRAVLEAVEAHEGDRVADEYRILTEADIDAASIENARLVCECAREHDRFALEAVRKVLPGPGEWSTFGEIGNDSGFGTRGYRAAVALVQTGLVAPEPGALIAPDAVAIGKMPSIRAGGFTR